MEELFIRNVLKLVYKEQNEQNHLVGAPSQISIMKRKLIGWRMATQAKIFTVDTPFVDFKVNRDGNILHVKRR